MIKLMLNRHKFNNYAFFCPVSRLHLTVSSPVGVTSEVTPAILKALKAETILDVDGVVDIETGTVKTAAQATAPAQEPAKPVEKAPEPKSPEQNDGDSKQDNPPVEEVKPEEKPKKGGRKSNKPADTE